MQKTIKRSKQQILKQPMKTKAVLEYKSNNISCIEGQSSRNVVELHKPPPQLYISHKRRQSPLFQANPINYSSVLPPASSASSYRLSLDHNKAKLN